jgi:hypothetical protein
VVSEIFLLLHGAAYRRPGQTGAEQDIVLEQDTGGRHCLGGVHAVYDSRRDGVRA